MYYKEKHRPNLPTTDVTSYRLSQKTCVITGATSGIGLATAKKLAEEGICKLIVVGSRDLSRGAAAAKQITERSTKRMAMIDDDDDDDKMNNDTNAVVVEVLPLDLSDRDSVRQFVEEVSSRHDCVVDILISCAAEIRNEPSLNSSGIDTMFATNHLGLQQLLVGMMPSLAKDARVVIVSSRLESKGKIDPCVVEESEGQQLRQGGSSWKDPMKHYADTKLANQLLVTELSRHWQKAESSITIVSVSPGMVHTKLWRYFPTWYQLATYPIRALALRDPEDAAKGVVFAAAANEVESGSFLADGKTIEPSKMGQDMALAQDLFKVCQKLLKVG